MRTRAVGVDLDDGAVQRYRFEPDAHDLFPLEVFKHPIEHPILRPAVHPCVNGMPVAEAGRQPSPLAALLGDIQDRVEHLQVRQFDIASLNGQDRCNAFLLSFCNLHVRMITFLHG